MKKPRRRFWRKLETMLRSGVPAPEAVETLRVEFEESELGDALGEVVEGLRDGEELADCLAEFPELFHPELVEALRRPGASGEEGGILAELQAAGEEIREAGEELGKGFEGLIAGLREVAAELPGLRRRVRRRRKIQRFKRRLRDAVGGEEEELEVVVEAQVRERGGSAPARAMALVGEAAEARASDVHLEATEAGGRVRFRVDGVLATRSTHDAATHRALVAGLKRAAGLDPEAHELPQDGRARFQVGGEAEPESLEVRVATGPTIHGESVTLRLLRVVTRDLKVEDVLAPELREAALELVHSPYGLLCVTGPTGSGKTTTLYALLNALDREGLKIVTVEDPVEVMLDGVHQIPVRPGHGFGFAAALRHALRMDPDVILCGEVRDAESAALLLRAALTGHLVLTSLHAPTAPEAVRRLVDIGLEPYLLGDALLGVVAQRLVRRLDTESAVESPEDLPRLRELLGGEVPEGAAPRRPASDDPASTGYRGRIAVQELLRVTPEVRRALQADADANALSAAARVGGYRSMRDHALQRVAAGTTSLSEVLRVFGP